MLSLWLCKYCYGAKLSAMITFLPRGSDVMTPVTLKAKCFKHQEQIVFFLILIQLLKIWPHVSLVPIRTMTSLYILFCFSWSFWLSLFLLVEETYTFFMIFHFYSLYSFLIICPILLENVFFFLRVHWYSLLMWSKACKVSWHLASRNFLGKLYYFLY